MSRNKSIMVALAVLIVVGGLIILALKGYDRPEAGESFTENHTATVLTTFYPTTYFAKTIGGEQVTVICPCPSDEDAIFWMPDRKTLAEYQKASLIIVNGAGFEKWIDKVSLPQERIVNSAEDLTDTLIRFKKSSTHSHGPVGEHSHKGIDGHTWVDPVNAIIQATAIKKALIRQFPQHENIFVAGFDRLKKQLESLDLKFKEISNGMPILCSHRAYNYIARRYGWNIENLDLDPGVKLSDQQILEIKNILKTHSAKTLIWESAPTEENVKLASEQLGLSSVVFSPCELLDPADIAKGVDYMTVMNTNIKVMKAVFSGVQK